MNEYDIIIIGGGHAGCEAAVVAERSGAKVALVTMDSNTLGKMSCNPAWGGIGKGHLVFEVTAMGGICGKAADATGIHFRRLNYGKGPAVRGTRVQCDRVLYSQTITDILIGFEKIKIIPVEVIGVRIENHRVVGVVNSDGSHINSKAVVVATGTFMGARLFRGDNSWTGGRIYEGSSNKLADQLIAMGINLRRLKTGTPPRISSKGIDLTKWIPQPGDEPAPGFTDYYNQRKQLLCYKSSTNEATHRELMTGFEKSPLFTGRISGVGPPYCPSIEDKVRRYPDRTEHPIFLEPEGWAGELWYLAGFSSSLPQEIQDKALRRIPGLREVIVTQYAYAVEYWALKSQEIDRTLAHPSIAGLYWAGQVCGTSGYEEAAGLGLVAGINATRFAFGKEPWVFAPESSYLGVMIRDLVESEQIDPYRILTSRAENRLGLREYNAKYRLAKTAWELGLISTAEYEIRRKEEEEIMAGKADSNKPYLAEEMDAVRRYEGYFKRYSVLDNKLKEAWEKEFGEIDWDNVVGLSNDGLVRIKKGKPRTLASAGRLGVRYTDLLLMMATCVKVSWRKHKNNKEEDSF